MIFDPSRHWESLTRATEALADEAVAFAPEESASSKIDQLTKAMDAFGSDCLAANIIIGYLSQLSGDLLLEKYRTQPAPQQATELLERHLDAAQSEVFAQMQRYELEAPEAASSIRTFLNDQRSALCAQLS